MEGTQFGKYRLIKLLGRGGMGAVWLAYDTVIRSTVAIKMLGTEISRDTSFQERFRREAHAARMVDSPHVIPIHNYGEIDGHLYVDMKLINGSDLAAVLQQGKLPPARAVYIVDQVAKALYATHRVGLLHRDIKPSNILLDDDDFAYLIDFGIARAADDLHLTGTNQVVGSVQYIAPERFDIGSRPIDPRSDIYSLACVLYECLTGSYPFPGDSMEQQIRSHLFSPPPRPSSKDPRLAPFDEVIGRGMAKNPNDRYPNAVEFGRAARDAVNTPVSAPQQYGPSRESNPVHHPRPNSVAAPRVLPPPGGSFPPQPIAPQPVPSRRIPVAPRMPSQPWWRRRVTVISAAVAVTAAAVVTAASIAMGHQGSAIGSDSQIVLPFSGLRAPQGVSVDLGGTVYVADTMHDRVLALPAGATAPAILPFTGLNFPTGVTADNSGTVYVTDAGNKRVVVLPAGSSKQTELPFTGLGNPTGVTVDGSRTVYVTDTENNQVLALDANSKTQTVLPFSGLNSPTGVVVDDKGTVYVADGGNNRVLALPSNLGPQAELPFSGLKDPGGVTVDNKGNVYVTDSGNNRVLKLPTGSNKQIELPFTGLSYPWGLAVDNLDTVYVSGHSNRVRALPQH
ncbi:MAG TPA: protein kinase [Mycobacterium sp.]|nr:protein kinase [Mycobacterium sp.]